MAQNDVEAKVRLVVDSKAFNATLKQANKEAKEFKRQQSSAFKGAGDDISKAFGNAIGAVTKLAPALSAGAAALAVAKKAMQENQTITNEWARITESARSTYEGFVNSLVTGNLTSFFSNMDEIIAKARDVADAFDALDTASLFSGREAARLGMEQEKYLSILRNKNVSAEEKAEAETALKEIFRQMGDETQKMSNYRFEAFAKRFVSNMAEHGSNVDWQSVIRRNEAGDYELVHGSAYQTYFNTLADYEGAVKRRDEEAKARGFYFNGKEWLKGEGALIGKGKGNMTDAEFAELNAAIQMSDEGIRELFSLLEGAYNDRAKYYRNLGRANRYLNSSGSGSLGATGTTEAAAPAGSIAEIEARLAEATKAWSRAAPDDEARASAQALIDAIKEELEVAKTGRVATDKLSPTGIQAPAELDLSTRTMTAGLRMEQEQEAAARKRLNDLIKDTTTSVSELTSAMYNFSASVHSATASFGDTSNTSYYAGSFATGGIIGGTSYRGDHLTAQVSSGEMILNKIQQRNLLSLAQGGGAMQVTTVAVSGDKLILAINNTLLNKGKTAIG